MTDLRQRAIEAFNKEEQDKKIRKGLIAGSAAKKTLAAEDALMASTKEWAYPILNQVFGKQDYWELSKPTHITVLVKIYPGRFLTVEKKTGKVKGTFTTKNMSRTISNLECDEYLEVWSLQHLGALLKGEDDLLSDRMRYEN